MKDMIKFDMPKNQSSIIKVIGVGGGGSNAVNHMYEQGIKGVDFLICNTDAQAMETSVIPTKIQLGDLGLGAGSIPSVGKEAANQKIDELHQILERNTKMLFITAGMGGGTGTGAAPVLASVAKELGILTVGIVTIPFEFEGRKRREQAMEGIKEMKEHVDTLLIICNDKLRELYGDLKLSEAFKQADNVLTTAAKGIAEIITVTGYINVDFEDVKTVMKDSGKAIMGSAEAEGDNRAIDAVKAALESPLLNDNDIEGASNVLLYIASGANEISMDEVSEITNYIQKEAKSQAEIIWGNGIDEDLGDKISITLIATGFDSKEKKKQQAEETKVRHMLDEEVPEFQPISAPVKEESVDKTRIELITSKAEEEVVHEEAVSEKREAFEIEEVPSLRNEYFEPGGFYDDDEPVVEKPELHVEDTHEAEEPIAEEEVVYESKETSEEETFVVNEPVAEEPEVAERTVVFNLHDDPPFTDEKEEKVVPEKPEPVFHEEFKPLIDKPENDRKPFEVYIKTSENEEVELDEEAAVPSPLELRTKERIEKLKNLSLNLKTQGEVEEMEAEPAYIRRNVEIDESKPSEESHVSKYALFQDKDKEGTDIRTNNSYLHDNVD